MKTTPFFLPAALLAAFLFVSCNDDDTLDKKTPGELSLEAQASTTEIEQGKLLQVELSVVAARGIQSLTADDTPIENIDPAATSQVVSYNHGIPLTATPGPASVVFQLTDKEGRTVTQRLDFLIIERQREHEHFVLAPNASIVEDNLVEQVDGDVIVLNATEQNFQVGDVIAGSEGGGFLRKVVSRQTQESSLILITEPALLTDLFETAELDFTFAQAAPGGRTKAGFPDANLTYAFNEKLLEDGASYLSVAGALDVAGSYDCKITIENRELVLVRFTASQIVADLDLTTVIHAEQSVGVVNNTYPLFEASKPIASLSPPVFGSVDLNVRARIESNLTAGLSATVHTVKKLRFDLEVWYQNGQWDYIQNVQELTDEVTTDIEGSVDIENVVTLIPEVNLNLYGVGGPFFRPGLFAALDIGASTEKYWDATLDMGYNGAYGVQVGAFGFLADFTLDIEEHSENFWKGPAQIRAHGGSTQLEATPGVPLENALKVVVHDSQENPMAFVPVSFSILSGQGILHEVAVMTDASGVAVTSVTPEGAMRIKASIKDRHGVEIDTEQFLINAFSYSVDEFSDRADGVFWYGESMQLNFGDASPSHVTKWYVDGVEIPTTRSYTNDYDEFDYTTAHIDVGLRQFQCKVYDEEGALLDQSALIPVTVVFQPVVYNNFFSGSPRKVGDRVYLGVGYADISIRGNISFSAVINETPPYTLEWFSDIQGNVTAISNGNTGQFDTFGLIQGTHTITARVHHPITGEFIIEPTPGYVITVEPAD